MSKFTAILGLICLLMAISATAQNAVPVLDTEGRPLQTGFEYSIEPAAVDSALGLTLAARNGSCPRYVAQNPGRGGGPSVGPNILVSFRPFAAGETVIREGRDTTVTMSAATTCVGSTAWRLGEQDPRTGRIFVVVGGAAGYFNIVNESGLYQIRFCPTDSCPNCRPRCQAVGILVQNGIRYLALGGNAFNFVFIRN